MFVKGRERFAFVRLREASRTAVQSVWLVSYVVSRVTVFLTAQYFKARFVWKCLHSTCTAVGLAVVAFIRLSVSSFGALIYGSTRSQRLLSAQQLQNELIASGASSNKILALMFYVTNLCHNS